MSDGAAAGLRVLMLSLNYAPEEIGIGPYSTGLATMLSARGAAVEVVAGTPYYPQWRRWNGWKQHSARMEDGVKVTRVRHYVPSRPTGAKRLAHHASFAAAALPAMRAAAGRLHPQIVFAVAPSLIAFPAARRAARKAGAKTWLHIQDLEVEAALETGLLSGGAARKAATAFERSMLQSADRISTISPQMARRIVGKGVPAERVTEVRNWANHDAEPDPASASQPLAEGRKLLLYSGNIGNKQGLNTVIAAARLLADRSDLEFLICGEGPNRERLEAQARGLENVGFAPLQPADRVAAMLRSAYLHLLPQIAGAADLVLPSKLANMLASGRPIVATAAPGTGVAEEVEGHGLVVEPGDPAALAGAIASLADDPDNANRLGAAGRARAAARWSAESVIDGLIPELRALAGLAG